MHVEEFIANLSKSNEIESETAEELFEQTKQKKMTFSISAQLNFTLVWNDNKQHRQHVVEQPTNIGQW